MLKIAIMTWFHYYNYGTALQAYASYKYLESKGWPVKVIKYYPVLKDRVYSSIIDEIFFRVKGKIYRMKNKEIISEIAGEQFQKFVSENIAFSEQCKTADELSALNKEIDIFICGSDQIWSPLNYDPNYFLRFASEEKKLIAYAPSFGVNTIEDKEIKKEIEGLLGRFSHLSVRERTGKDIINMCGQENVEVVLDPTLLIERKEWEDLLDLRDDIRKPYLLVYFLGVNKIYWKRIYQIAKILQLDVRIIPIYKKDLHRKGKVEEDVGPREFVNLIRNASYVCTDSFHAMIFSINFNKEFLTFARFKNRDKSNQNSRVFDFLNSIGLENRLYNKTNSIDNYTKKIDYKDTNKVIDNWRKASKNYLDNALKNNV